MKRIILSQKPAISGLAAFCFFIGIFAGTILANWNGGKLAAVPGVADGMIGLIHGSGGIREKTLKSGMALCAEVLGRRWLFTGAMWLLGMSLLAVPGMLCVIGWLGFSMSFLISSYTAYCGLGGLAVFLASVFPQIICYLPVCAVLILWALCGQQRIHFAGFFVLLLFTALGAFAEAVVSPGLAVQVWNWFS